MIGQMKNSEYMIIVSSNPNCPKTISFKYLDESQAYKNHMQTLSTLNRRGGMSPVEVVANIEKKSFWKLGHDMYDEIYFVDKLKKYMYGINEIVFYKFNEFKTKGIFTHIFF
jgi:hypothetical protein